MASDIALVSFGCLIWQLFPKTSLPFHIHIQTPQYHNSHHNIFLLGLYVGTNTGVMNLQEGLCVYCKSLNFYESSTCWMQWLKQFCPLLNLFTNIFTVTSTCGGPKMAYKTDFDFPHFYFFFFFLAMKFCFSRDRHAVTVQLFWWQKEFMEFYNIHTNIRGYEDYTYINTLTYF